MSLAERLRELAYNLSCENSATISDAQIRYLANLVREAADELTRLSAPRSVPDEAPWLVVHFDREYYFSGVRYEAGDYQIRRCNPQDKETVF